MLIINLIQRCISTGPEIYSSLLTSAEVKLVILGLIGKSLI